MERLASKASHADKAVVHFRRDQWEPWVPAVYGLPQATFTMESARQKLISEEDGVILAGAPSAGANCSQ